MLLQNKTTQEIISFLKDKKILDKNGNPNPALKLQKLKENNLEIYNEMLEFCKLINPQSLKEMLYHFVNKIPEVKRCKVCNNNLRFTHYKQGYLTYCSVSCMIKCEDVKQKVKSTNVERYNSEYSFSAPVIIEKIRKTMMERHGVEHAIQNKDILNKLRKTNLERYGNVCILHSEVFKEKIVITNLEKYGVPNAAKSKQVQDKIKLTCIKKYGVQNVWQLEGCRQKIKETNLKRYGYECASQSEEIKEKVKQTCQLKWGVDNPWQSEECKQKAKETSLEKYGVEYPMQNIDILNKSFENRKHYSFKKYTLPNNEVIQVQGYEPQYLDWYFKNNGKLEDICFQRHTPSIKYVFENKSKLYHPDFYIKSTNTVIEIKSEYTYNCELEQNLAKQKACIDQGYDFKFYIMNADGSIQSILHNNVNL